MLQPSFQCDQIGQNFAIYATFSLNQFSPKQAASTHDLFEDFKNSSMWVFWDF
jgi:hypothetical protein